MGSYVALMAYAQYRLIKKIAAAGLQASHKPLSPLEEEDTLGPFTTLTTEEEWSKKAEHQLPGTYYVVANTSSFSNTEEYRSTRGEAVSRSSTQDGDNESHGRNLNTNVPIGTDTLILGTFGDSSRRPASTSNSTTARQSPSTNTSPNSPKPTKPTKPTQGSSVLRPLSPLLQRGAQRQSVSPDLSEAQLFSRYRSFVRRHMLQTNRDPAISSTEISDVIEEVSAHFKPVCQGPFPTRRTWLTHTSFTMLC